MPSIPGKLDLLPGLQDSTPICRTTPENQGRLATMVREWKPKFMIMGTWGTLGSPLYSQGSWWLI